MDDSGGFQTQFTSVMENVLKTAVGEATRLFERTLHQLRGELVHLRQENADLKTGAFARQFNARHAGDGEKRTDQAPGPPKCDVGVQCEKPLMVERCCSPAPFSLQDIASDRLADLCSSASEDGNRQLALLLIKKEPQETACDEYAPGYFLLKQEGAEPILVRKEPFKNTMERGVGGTGSTCRRPTSTLINGKVLPHPRPPPFAPMPGGGLPVQCSVLPGPKPQFHQSKAQLYPARPALSTPAADVGRQHAESRTHSLLEKNTECSGMWPNSQQCILHWRKPHEASTE
ncbi:hypothetical protein NFI96_018210, partial [Prochilodus magdalenae]